MKEILNKDQAWLSHKEVVLQQLRQLQVIQLDLIYMHQWDECTKKRKEWLCFITLMFVFS